MIASQYQKMVTRTMRDLTPLKEAMTAQQLALLNYGLGAAGEAGEAADHIKKHVFHGHALDVERLRKEIGDVLWYAAALCETLGVGLGDVMAENDRKLRERYPDGFSNEASLARKDVNAGVVPPSPLAFVCMHGVSHPTDVPCKICREIFLSVHDGDGDAD